MLNSQKQFDTKRWKSRRYKTVVLADTKHGRYQLKRFQLGINNSRGN